MMKPTKVASPLEFIGPVDEDLLLAVAVLQQNATAEELSEFERRYVDDEAFNEKVGPLVELWLSPIDLREIVAEVRGEAPAAAAPRAEAAGVPMPIPPLDASPASAEQSAYTRPPESKAMSAFRAAKDLVVVGGGLAAAASLILFVIVGYQAIQFTRDDKPDGVIAVTKVAPARSSGPGEPAGEKTHIETRRARFGEPEWTSERSRVALDFGGVSVVADSTEEKTIELDGGSRIVVRRGSTVRRSGATIEVFGEAAIEVTEQDGYVRVISRAGTARLRPGSHVVRCVGACEALEVTVSRGAASIMTDRIRDHNGIQVPVGRRGLAFKDSAKLVPAPAAR
jgi:hypothetical protein